MKIQITVLALVCLVQLGYSQEESKILFLGNSYTYYNDLPGILVDLAANAGQDLTESSNTPGGASLQGHSSNNTTLNLIAQGDWDFVVLQDQSQMPSFPEGQFMADSYEYAQELNQAILGANPCTETVFYMTWGRENGDASNCPNWPPVCTYEGMDDLLAERYQLMATDFSGIVSPVGKVWRYLRDNELNVDLYNSDESHPSMAGSYAAAVTFFTTIYRMDPTILTENSGLDALTAETIREAVKQVVYLDLQAHLIGTYDIQPAFEVIIYENTGDLEFINTSINATQYTWNINGEEFSSEDVYYTADYQEVQVTLTAENVCGTSTSEVMTYGFGNSIEEKEVSPLLVYPNPVKDNVSFNKTVERVQIKDYQGKELETLTVNDNQVNLEHLSPGKYLLLCFTLEGEFTFEMIKE